MARLTLSLLGPPDIRSDGQTLHFPTRRALALLVYLAVEERPLPRESLIPLLWPEADAARGRGSLRTALVYLRRALGPAADRIRVGAGSVQFALAPGDNLDLEELKTTVERARPDSLELQAVIHRYRGDFLAGFSLDGAADFDSWMAEQREHGHRLLGQAFDSLTHRQLDERQYSDGLANARRWVVHDPLDEAAYRRLMQLHLAAGDRAAALLAFEAGRARLQRELDVGPSRETSELADRARRDTRPPPGRERGEPAVPTSTASAPASPKLDRLPFVGRLQEHRRLSAAFRMPLPQIAVIAGEAGIGKTRLAEEFTAWAAAQGAEVVRGRAFEAGGRLPYQPLVDALRARVEALNAPEDLLADTWLAELSRLLPELRERYPDLPVPAGDEALSPTRLPEAIARLLQALAARATGKLVCFVDDVQWADAASLDVLAYLARRLAASGQPALLLLTARAEALAPGQALAAWISGLARDLPVARLPLEPMSAAEIQQLLDACRPGLDRDEARQMSDWLLAETQGQPFFVAETLKLLADNGWRREAIKAGSVAPGVREMILARVGVLAPAGRDLLTAAAVLGRPASFAELAQVAKLDEDEALTALDVLLASGLLNETGGAHDVRPAAGAHNVKQATGGAHAVTLAEDGQRPYALAHDTVREVLYSEAGQARRRVFHRRVVESLAGSAPPAELARHALAAGLVQPAFTHSLAAGEAALKLFAVRDALHHFEQASSAGETGGLGLTPDEARRLYTGLGRAHELLAETDRAKAAYQALLAYAGGEPGLGGLALSHLATLAVHAYAFAEAADHLREAARLAEQAGDEAGLADREWRLAQLAHHQFDFRASLAHAERALALARSLNAAALIAGCLNSLGYAHLLLGEMQAGQAALEEARERYAALADRAMEVDCLTALAAIQVWGGRAAAGAARAQAAHAIAVEIENPWGQIYSSNWLAIARLDQGDAEGALAAAQGGRLVAERHDFMPVALINLLILGGIQRARGDLGQAREVHLTALALSQQQGTSALGDVVAAELCSDCALLGDWTTAADYARVAAAARTYQALPLVIPLRWTETEALLRAGETRLAQEDAQRWGALVANVPRLRLSHLASLVVLAEHAGDPAAAKRYAAEAQALAELVHVSQPARKPAA